MNTTSGWLTTEEHDKLMWISNWWWILKSNNDFNAQDRKYIKETHEKVLKLENTDTSKVESKIDTIENSINENNSQIEFAKEEILDRINESEIDLRKDVRTTKTELKDDNVKTRNLVRQKTEKLDKNISKLSDRQDLTDKLIEEQADEIEDELEWIYNMECDMIENEIFNKEADQIEQELNSNQKTDGNDIDNPEG